MIADELAHELDAFVILDDFDLHAVVAKLFFRSLEGDIFPDDNTGNPIQQNRARAHGAGRQCRKNCAARVDGCLLAPGIFQTIHLGVMDHTAELDALVMATTDDLPIADQHRADGNAAFAQTVSGLVNRRLEKMIDGAL